MLRHVTSISVNFKKLNQSGYNPNYYNDQFQLNLDVTKKFETLKFHQINDGAL